MTVNDLIRKVAVYNTLFPDNIDDISISEMGMDVFELNRQVPRAIEEVMGIIKEILDEEGV